MSRDGRLELILRLPEPGDELPFIVTEIGNSEIFYDCDGRLLMHAKDEDNRMWDTKLLDATAILLNIPPRVGVTVTYTVSEVALCE